MPQRPPFIRATAPEPPPITPYGYSLIDLARQPASLQGLVPPGAAIRAQTSGDILQQWRDTIGRKIAPLLGLDFNQMAAEEARGRNIAMLPFAGNLYHGTKNVFGEFSDEAARAGESLYGPGHYFTDVPEVASDYAMTKNPPRIPMSAEQRAQHFTPGNVVESYGGGADRVLEYVPGEKGDWRVKVIEQRRTPEGGYVDAPGARPRWHFTNPEIQPSRVPNVRVARVELQKPFNVEEAPASGDIEKLAGMFRHEGNAEAVDQLRSAKTNDHVYRTLNRIYENRDDVNHVLQNVLGYDGIVYPGGTRVAGARPHQAFVVFSEQSLKPPQYPLRPSPPPVGPPKGPP